MDTFTIIQIAVAVMLGNLLTRMVLSGWKKIKRDDDVTWRSGLFYAAPMVLLALVIIGSKG